MIRGMSMFPGKFTAQEIADRWQLSRSRVFQIEQEDPKMPRGERIGGGESGRAAFVLFDQAEILQYERDTGRGPAPAGETTTEGA